MNGRAYDPELGRFLSVDPFIQFPDNSQSLNAYSYVLNNPLAGTDPTGYLFVGFGPGYRREEAPSRPRGELSHSGGFIADGLSEKIAGMISHGLTSNKIEMVSKDVIATIDVKVDGVVVARIKVTGKVNSANNKKEATSQGDVVNSNDVPSNAKFTPTVDCKRAKCEGGGTGVLISSAFSSIESGGNTSSLNANSGTQDLFKQCTGGNSGSCATLKSQNKEDLRIAYTFILNNFPEITDRVGGLFSQSRLQDIQFDYSKEFNDAKSGHTSPILGEVTLGAAYNSRADLVDTVAHELLHSGDGYFGRMTSGYQDKRAKGLYNGVRHKSIRSISNIVKKSFERKEGN